MIWKLKTEETEQEESYDNVIDILTGWQVRFWLQDDYPDKQDWRLAVDLLSSRGITPDKKPGSQTYYGGLDFSWTNRMLLPLVINLSSYNGEAGRTTELKLNYALSGSTDCILEYLRLI